LGKEAEMTREALFDNWPRAGTATTADRLADSDALVTSNNVA
jgi:hypothetical protein